MARTISLLAAIAFSCVACVTDTTSQVEPPVPSTDDSEEKTKEPDTCFCDCATELACMPDPDCGNSGMSAEDLHEGAAYLKQFLNDKGDALIDKHESSLIEDILSGHSDPSLAFQESVDIKDLLLDERQTGASTNANETKRSARINKYFKTLVQDAFRLVILPIELYHRIEPDADQGVRPLHFAEADVAAGLPTLTYCYAPVLLRAA